MQKMIFVNFPVKDLAKSIEFYKVLGFRPNPEFTNDVGAYMAWSDTIAVMLVTHDFYKKFIGTKTISDSRNSSEVLISFSIESKAEVDSLVKKALDNGGKLLPVAVIPGAESMYVRDVEDLDGHILEFGYWELPTA